MNTMPPRVRGSSSLRQALMPVSGTLLHANATTTGFGGRQSKTVCLASINIVTSTVWYSCRWTIIVKCTVRYWTGMKYCNIHDIHSAGADCTASMYARKIDTYSMHQDVLERQNITYQPLVFSAYGRPHPQSTAILRTLVKQLARRRGCSDGEWRYKKLRAAIGAEIWRRAASQVIACWPDGDDSLE